MEKTRRVNPDAALLRLCAQIITRHQENRWMSDRDRVSAPEERSRVPQEVGGG
jgi:hypothetical protein